MSGSNYASSGNGVAGNYGTRGTPSPSNVPGSRSVSTGWTDSSGNFWIFGGFDADAATAFGYLNDVWKFSPASNQWTWIAGSNTFNAPAIFGNQGVAASQNTPGARIFGANWTDASGNIWMFGGNNYLVSGMTGGYLGDLWMFSPTTNMWTWMGGSQTDNAVANYGSMEVSAATNQPGGRYGSFSWADSSGNFWMFGGYGFYSFGGSPDEGTTDQGDMWEYSPKTQEWTWVGGNIPGIHGNDSPGVYGTQGMSSATNQPGARELGCSWTDASGNFWMFGGVGWDSKGNRDGLNDLWEFSPSTMQWTWISGSNQVDAPGNYGMQGVAAASNVPGARWACVTWKDSSGNLWLFGGSDTQAGVSNSDLGDLGDLWMFNPNTKQWTWVSGSNQINATGSYGAEGTFGSSNIPAARRSATAFSDSSGHLWLFGGFAGSSAGPDSVPLNDLWEFNP